MAAGAVNVITLVNELTVIFNDADFALFSEAEYTRFILRHILGDARTYNFPKVIAGPRGLYNYGPKIYLYKPTYSPSDDCSGTLDALGNIEITSGEEPADPVVVTGVTIGFPEVVVDCCLYAATNRAQVASQTLAGGSFSVEDTQKKLLEMATYWRGARGAG